MSTNNNQCYSDPVSGREFYRAGNDFKVSTFGKFGGYIQTNIACIPAEFSKDFRDFCAKNSAPLPLLYESSVGEIQAPILATDSDIRTDVATYLHYKDGERMSEPLSHLSQQNWESMVTLYLGCSFTFDHKLSTSGIKLQTHQGNVSMFESNISCLPSGPFHCNMILSMRPVPQDMLSQVVNLSLNMDFCHGAPIHIGSPYDILLDNKLVDIFGNEVVIADNDVPCFWACGVTSNMALKSAKLPVAYSHYPGSMFVADVKSVDGACMFNSLCYSEAIVICTNYSQYISVSVNTWKCLQQIDDIVAADPGNRGIQHLRVAEDFGKACLDLSMRAKNVGIFVGFPLFEEIPAEENDGIAGAIYLARSLQAIGTSVTFFLDSSATRLKEVLSGSADKGFLHSKPHIITVGDVNDVALQDKQGNSLYTHFIAIERACAAGDGKYYTMSARDITANMGSMNMLFGSAHNVTTIGIGDGGNEVGMGKVKSQVAAHIPNGELIAADISTDYLIACGVSNWGGAAIAAGLYAVRQCSVHDRYVRRGIGYRVLPAINDFMLTSEQDALLQGWLMEGGFRDGVSGKVALTVDGLDYQEHHAPILQQLTELVNQE